MTTIPAAPWYVSYLHGQGYRVRRQFDTRELAQQFVDVNALVYPLPGVELGQQWRVMTPSGWNDSPVLALDADAACALVAQRGHEVVDVMDDVVVIADEG